MSGRVNLVGHGPSYWHTIFDVMMTSQQGPRTFKLVTEKAQFLLSTRKYIFTASQVVQSFSTTLVQFLKAVCFI